MAEEPVPPNVSDSELADADNQRRVDDDWLKRRWAATQILQGDPATAAPMPVARAAAVSPVLEGPRGLPVIDWEGQGVGHLKPKVLPFPKPKPGEVGGWTDSDPLPEAGIVVMTWTSAEWDALHYVFSNDLAPLPNSRDDNRWRSAWYPYRKDFYTVFNGLWLRRLVSARRSRPIGAPSLNQQNLRWGSFAICEVAMKKVLLFKSELHINQDGESLPLVQLVEQIVSDCKPSLLLSVGTSGGVRLEDGLGDTVVTNAGTFRLGDEFESASFNHQTYRSTWTPPNGLLPQATKLLMEVPEFTVQQPTASYGGATLNPKPHSPSIKIVNEPLLTTDFFEYGTTTNGLGGEGCCVEMDDAVVAMVCDRLNDAGGRKVTYGFLRNISDPVINGDMPRELQTAWAVLTYQLQGLYTSFNSAIATWAMIAG